MDRGWRLAAIAVLTITILSWIRDPDTAGFFGGGAWLALLFLPALGLRKASELAARQRYVSARKLVDILRVVHPAAGLRAQSRLLQAMVLAQNGDAGAALVLLQEDANVQTATGRNAIAQSFRIRGDWNGLLNWFRNGRTREMTPPDLTLLPLYLRALGETGASNELVQEFNTYSADLSSVPQYPSLYPGCLIILLAFTGRAQDLAQRFQARFGSLSADTRTFWLGTAELVAGELETGRRRLENLRATTQDAIVRGEAARRLERTNDLRNTPLAPATENMLRQIIARRERPSTRLFGTRKIWATPVVLTLIALNVVMFLAELRLGGSTNPYTLYRLGALDLFSVLVAGEYWRLVTSLFLHFGPLHLLFNLYALSVIGPGLEQAIGPIRFAICYLVSGLGSSIGVLALHLIGVSRTEQLVGASGCVMGLVGVWAGLFLRHRNAPHAARRLKNILVIVAIQTAFDLSTPQISMAAHLSGLLTGAFLGLILSPRTLPE